MSAPVARWRMLASRISRSNVKPILSISCAMISLGCITEGFYFLGMITAGANLIVTRWAVRSSKKGNLAAGG
jgi:hypothetical protein